MFLLAVNVVKISGNWDEITLPFGIKPPAFESMMIKFFKLLQMNYIINW